MLFERPNVYPERDRVRRQRGSCTGPSPRWHRVCRMNDRGEPETFCQLSDGHVPDGMAFAANGRLFVATDDLRRGHRDLAEGAVLDRVNLGEHATNCIFDGSVLYVTATKSARHRGLGANRQLLAGCTPARPALPLLPGRL